MRLALDLGRRGLGRTAPNPAVGAVIVKDGVIVGRGWTQAGGRPHAEVEALRRAKRAAHGATMYVTLEPCSHHGQTPPCADAVIKAGIARVVSAMEDPNPEVAGQGHARLRDKKIAVDVGLLGDEARRAHAGHIARVTQGRPRVLVKLAVSADGKAGSAGRKQAAITGEEARARVFMMRAQNDAILTGIGTVLADNPQLTCRLPGMSERSPVRVVLDAQLRTPLSLAVVSTVREWPTWVFCSAKASRVAEDILQQKGVRVFRVAGGGRQARPRRRAEDAQRRRHHPADGRGRADGGGELRRRRPGRRSGAAARRRRTSATSGIDALEGHDARHAHRRHDQARQRNARGRHARTVRAHIMRSRTASQRSPGALQYVVLQRRPGVVQNSECGKAPDLRRITSLALRAAPRPGKEAL